MKSSAADASIWLLKSIANVMSSYIHKIKGQANKHVAIAWAIHN